MVADHYATLGITPYADRAVIRAAYVELMRRYHPDRNSSPLAEPRVRAITAAYAVLGVADRRARYDLERARARAARRTAAASGPPLPKVAPYLWLLAGIPVVLLLVWVMVPPPLPIASERPHRRAPSDARQAVAVNEAPPRELSPFDRTCSSSTLSDPIRHELFRRAARLRGSDQAVFASLAAHSFARVEPRPLARQAGDAHDCTVSIVLYLPPGVEAYGGLRHLTGQVGFSRSPGSDESGGEISTVSAGLLELLATVTRTPAPVAAAIAPPIAPVPPTPFERPALLETARSTVTPANAPPARASRQPPASPQNPSFSCRSARSWAATAVCGSASLATLDRGLATLYGDSMDRAEAAKRTLLIEGDRRFLANRDSCASEACVRGAYLTRIQAIHSMMGRGPAAR